MFIVKKRLEIAGAHCLDLPYESKCENLHGHNWIITVHCRASELNASGMVIDFTDIKKTVMQFDHQNINDYMDGNPTAERMAHHICQMVPNCFRVDVQESEGNTATYEI